MHHRRSKPPALEPTVGSVGFGLATLAERTSHSHPAFTVAGATRIEHHCGTCGDRHATDFFRSALPAHIARPMPYRFSRLNRPAIFCRSFFWALLQANSCVLQLRGFCFPGSALTPLGSLPKSSRSLWKQKPLLPGAPITRAETGEKSCTYMLSGIASRCGSLADASGIKA